MEGSPVISSEKEYGDGKKRIIYFTIDATIRVSVLKAKVIACCINLDIAGTFANCTPPDLCHSTVTITMHRTRLCSRPGRTAIEHACTRVRERSWPNKRDTVMTQTSCILVPHKPPATKQPALRTLDEDRTRFKANDNFLSKLISAKLLKNRLIANLL